MNTQQLENLQNLQQLENRHLQKIHQLAVAYYTAHLSERDWYTYKVDTQALQWVKDWYQAHPEPKPSLKEVAMWMSDAWDEYSDETGEPLETLTVDVLKRWRIFRLNSETRSTLDTLLASKDHVYRYLEADEKGELDHLRPTCGEQGYMTNRLTQYQFWASVKPGLEFLNNDLVNEHFDLVSMLDEWMERTENKVKEQLTCESCLSTWEDLIYDPTLSNYAGDPIQTPCSECGGTGQRPQQQ